MPDPTITTPPTAPSRASKSAFVATTNAFLDYLVTLANELIALIPWVRARVDEVNASKDAAATSAGNASTSAGTATTKAVEAAGSAGGAADDRALCAQYLAAFQSDFYGPHTDDAAVNAWAAGEGITISDGVFYYKDAAPKGLRIRSGGAWSTAVLDANGALMVANNLSELDASAAKSNLGIKPVASADFATKAEAEAGAINTKPMTPLRTKEAIVALVPPSAALLAVVQDQKPSGTNGGSLSTGWRTRELNTVTEDPSGIVALSSNQFTPSVDCGAMWSTPVYVNGDNTAFHSRIVRVSDGAVVSLGTSHRTAYAAHSVGSCRLDAGVAYRLEIYSDRSVSGFGEGWASNSGNPEVYSQVTFWS